MNSFFIIILIALVLDYTLRLVANILNLRALKLEVPPELEGVYQTDDYRRAQEYTRALTRFDFVVSTFRLLVLLVFWFMGGFNYLDQAIRAWGFGPIVRGLLYIGILLAANSLLMLPFSIYSTFVIEERFGFNRTTPRMFFLDRVKLLALGVLLGGPLLAGILALFEYAGPYAWVYGWIAAVIFSLVMQLIVPTWIMPLFNKFTPIESGALKDAIFQYAISANFPIKNVFVMDSSKRSTKLNAFFIGFGRNKRVVLFDTLVEKYAIPEIVAVLAHEVGHYKHRHIVQGMFISILHTGVVFFLLSIFLNSSGLYQAFYMAQPSVYAGLLFFGLLYTPVELVLSIFMQMLSRKNESEADRFAARTIDGPASLIEALKKLSASNFSNLTPHPFYVFLNYSHPPLLQRVEAIQRYQKPASG